MEILVRPKFFQFLPPPGSRRRAQANTRAERSEEMGTSMGMERVLARASAAYVVFLAWVYVACYARAAAASGESFDCNTVEVRSPESGFNGLNGTHSLSKLKIASLNAEWLFDGKDDPSYSPWHPGKTSCPGMKHCGTEQGAQDHISKISEYVKLVNADILNLVEVEDCNILREVIDRSRVSEYSPLLRKGIDTATKQNVAMLTKLAPTEPLYRLDAKASYPVEGSACGYTKEGKRTTLSKNYVAHFDINGMTVAFHSLHLKAFPKDPYSCAKREGQAKIARDSIRESIDRGHEVVVFGDFNDFSYEFQDVQDSVPTSKVLSILRGETEDGKTDLVNVMEYISKGERYSNWWDKNGNDVVDGSGEYSQIDHVLLSKKLASHVSEVEIFHGYDPALVSDHFPVIVSFDFGEKRGALEVPTGAEGETEGEEDPLTTTHTAEIALACLVLFVVASVVVRRRSKSKRTDGQVSYQMAQI